MRLSLTWTVFVLCVPVLGPGLLRVGGGEKAGKPRGQAADKERANLQGHTQPVCCVAFSPDGKLLASSGADGTVRLWDPETGKALATLEGHVDGAAICVAFSPDGKTLASGGSDQTVRFWDVPSGKAARTLFRFTGSVWGLAFSPSGETLAVAGEGERTGRKSPRTLGEVGLWDVRTGTQRQAFRGYHGGVRSVAFSPDGRTVAAGDEWGRALLWEVPSGQLRALLRGYSGRTTSLAFAAGGRVLVCGYVNGTVQFWDLPSGESRARLRAAPEHDHVYGVALGKGEKVLATTSEYTALKLWNVKDGKELLRIGPNRAAWPVAFSPDGKRFAAGVGNTIKLWDTARLLGKE
jgi:WD40 repeat protein